VREAAVRALQIAAAGGLLHLLRSAQPEQKISQRKTSGIIHAFLFGAFLAQIDLLHLVTHDLGEMHLGLSFFADTTLHGYLCERIEFPYARAKISENATTIK
jgi:hypothetical protein